MAKQKILVNINLNGNAIESFAVDPLTSNPTNNLQAGRMYFNTVDSKLMVYDGTSWNEVGGGDSIDFDIVTGVDESSTDGNISVTTRNEDGTTTTADVAVAGFKSASTSVTSASTNNTVATSKSVYDYVNPIDVRLAAAEEDISSLAGGVKYIGVVSSTSPLPTTGVKAGYMYKVSENGTYAGQAAKVGDLFIAKNDTPTWDLIPSGDDGNTNTYTATNPALTTSGTVCTWEVTHGLNRSGVNVDIYEKVTGDGGTINYEKVIASVTQPSNNNNKVYISFVSTSNITAGTYKVVCTG